MTPAHIKAISALLKTGFFTAASIASSTSIPLKDVHTALETIRQGRGRMGYLASRPGRQGGYALVDGGSRDWLFTKDWVQNWRSSMGLQPSQSPLL